MPEHRIYSMKFSTVYPLLVRKVERKGRGKKELDRVICWLTGYDPAGLKRQLRREVDFRAFFAEAPRFNPDSALIKGVVCGIRVEEVEDPLMRKIRQLDKLVDELAHGKPMEKVLRSGETLVAASKKTAAKSPSAEAQLRSIIGKFDPKTQKLIRSLRSALRKRFPTANELAYDYGFSLVIGYAPSEAGIESIVAISARGKEVALYFNNGARLPDPKKLLKGSAKLVRFVTVESARDLANPDVKAFMDGAEGLSKVPMPSKGKGALIMKSGGASKKKPRPKAKKKIA